MRLVIVPARVHDDGLTSTKGLAALVASNETCSVELLEPDASLEAALRVIHGSQRLWFEGFCPLVLRLLERPDLDMLVELKGILLRCGPGDVNKLPFPRIWSLLSDIIVPTSHEAKLVQCRGVVPAERGLHVAADFPRTSATQCYKRIVDILVRPSGSCSSEELQRQLDVRATSLAPSPLGCAADTLDRPLVSAIIPVRNEEKTVSAAIDSLRRQSYGHLEILVVDDGSTDATPEIIRRHLVDERVQHLAKEVNEGIPFGRNCGIERARGEYIVWLGADDQLLDDSLDALVAAARQSGADLVHGEGLHVTAEGKLTEYRRYRDLTPQTLPRRLMDGLYAHCPILDSSMLVRRDLYDRVGHYNTEFLRGSDCEFFIRCAQHGIKTHYLRRPLAIIDQSHPPERLTQLRRLGLDLNLKLAMRMVQAFGLERMADPISVALKEDGRLVMGRHLLLLALQFEAPDSHEIWSVAAGYLVPLLQEATPVDRSEALSMVAVICHQVGDNLSAVGYMEQAVQTAQFPIQARTAQKNLDLLRVKIRKLAREASSTSTVGV